jgi:hypothetical protein
MEYILICAALYIILTITDIVPAIKKKKWKSLMFSIPVFLITFAVHIMKGAGVKCACTSEIIERIVTSILKL